MRNGIIATALCLAVVLGAVAGAEAQDKKEKTLTIWWAAWDPSVGLQKLGDEWGASKGVKVTVVQIPWSDFYTKWNLESGKDKTDFDIVVGDSQWVGLGATKGRYLDLTDFLNKNVDMKTLHPKAAKYLSEYPTGSGKFFSAPCETDSMGLAYRKDWFEDAKEKEAFKTKYNRDLAPPATWEELRDVAEFFHRPAEKRYGWSVLTGRGYDALTMGFEENLWAWGGDFYTLKGPKKVQVDGVINSQASIDALTFFKDLLKFGPEGAATLDYVQCMEVFTNGTTAMCGNYFAFFPFIHKQMGDKVGFAMIPKKGSRHVISLGGQGLSVSTKIPPEQQELAKEFIAWFHKTETQKKWVTHTGCFTGNVDVLKSEEFKKASPWNAVFAESLDYLQDFTNEPFFGDLLNPLQKYLGEALDGKKSPKEALSEVVVEFEDVFKKNGYEVVKDDVAAPPTRAPGTAPKTDEGGGSSTVIIVLVVAAALIGVVVVASKKKQPQA
jgi:multiple sugar transport system substrate-binding protein